MPTKNPHAVALGSIRSAKKRAASQRNARTGGRPRVCASWAEAETLARTLGRPVRVRVGETVMVIDPRDLSHDLRDAIVQLD